MELSVSVDFKRKRRQALQVASNPELNELQKRVLLYFVLTYERGEEFELSLPEMQTELNIPAKPSLSVALSTLAEHGFISKRREGHSMKWRLLRLSLKQA
jgi:hypothetical protein